MLTKNKSKILFLFFIVSFVLILVGWLLTWSLDSKSGKFVVCWSDLGIGRIGDRSDFLFIGTIGFLIIFLNFFLFLELRKKDSFFGILIALLTLFISILIFAAFMSIISVN